MPFEVIVPEHAKLPLELVMVQPVAELPPAMLTSIAPSAWRFRAVVVAPIVPVPAKVKAVAEVAIVSIEVTPVSAPPVETFKPLEVKAKVPVALPIEVFPVEEVFRFRVGAVNAAVPEESVYVSAVRPVAEIEPEVAVKSIAPVDIVNPSEAVKVPSEFIVPPAEVEMLPVVVTVPASVIVNEETPPDWMSTDILDAAFVSLSIKALAVPWLVKVRDVDVASPEARVSAIFLADEVRIVLPVS